MENSSGLGGSLRSLRELGPAPAGMVRLLVTLLRGKGSGDVHLESQSPLGAWRLLQKERVDVLHVNNAPVEAWGMVLAAAWEGIPVACHLRTVRPLRKVERLLSSSLDRFLTLSDHHAHRLKTTVPVSVLPHPMEDPGLRPEALMEPGVVGILSVLKPGKGHDLALRALAGVQGSWKLRIAGGSLPDQPSPRAELEHLARELGVADKVEFLGHIHDPRLFLARCELLLDPSSKAEGFRRTVAEAALLGCPVLASAAGGESDILPSDQILPCGDMPAWKTAIERSLGNPAAAHARALETRQRALRHLHPSHRDKFWELLAALVPEKV